MQKWVTPASPRATSEAAGSVVETSATLNAAVNPGALATQYKFEWGPTAAYGNSMPVSAKSVGAGAKDVKVSEKVEGLKPWVIYHFRVAATNAEGTTYSQDQEFTTWGEWNLESPPLPKASTSSSLADVSCTSTINCVAVGYDSYADRMLGEVWDGTKWTLRSGDTGQSPTSISCGSASSCWAIGTSGAAEVPLIERWESGGGSWGRGVINTGPIVPEGGTDVRLTGISCATANECNVVGYYTKGGQPRPLAERLEKPSLTTKWTVQSTPEISGGRLSDIACSSASSCVAVGYKQEKNKLPTPPAEALSMRWNGTEWSTLAPPAPKEKFTDWRLVSVACPSASSCVAIGSYTNEEGKKSQLAFTYNGSTWSSSTMPTAKAAYSLASVSCASAGNCLAVGHSWEGEGGTFAVGLSGSEWTVRSSPTPKEKNAWLESVSCLAPLTCTTVGKSIGGGETAPLAERVGEIWTLESPPMPSASNKSALADIACPSPFSCVGVGTDSYTGRGLGETWDGEKWTLMGGEDESSPTSISCGSASSCWAIGTSGAAEVPLIERWESGGGSWGRGVINTGPIVPEGGTDVRLTGISCATANECNVVGYYTKGGQPRPLAERLEKPSLTTKWTVQSTPEISGGRLSDIACSSASSCVAVGYKQEKNKLPTPPAEALSMRWNGTEWSTLAPPAPKEKFTDWRLVSVACPSASSCVAIGSYTNEEGKKSQLAFTYNGSTWSSSTMPTAKAAYSLASVSCASAGNCLAVGHSWEGEGGTFAVGLSGSEWTVRSSPTPKEKNAWLESVSCLAPLTCTTVGKSIGGGETAPLALRVELRNQEATTGSATSVSSSAATLSATVNPHGLSTQYSFEYGPTLAYGKTVPSASAGSGIKDVAVSKAISGLEAGRLYHYRLLTTSAVGTTYGQDKTFTTPPPTFAFALAPGLG